MNHLPSRRNRRQQEALDRLAPWQRDIAEAVLDGRPVTATTGRSHRRHLLAVFLGAAYELEGRSWDVTGTDPDQARTIRRQARELAAQLDSPQETGL